VVTRVEGKSDHIRATGNPVTFKQDQEGEKEPVRGRSQAVEYDTDSEMIQMIGDSVLYQGKDSFKSDRITYDRIKSQVRAGASAKGKQRVRITIESKQKLEKVE
jgi:lipopolysaccharide export system protein LptA